MGLLLAVRASSTTFSMRPSLTRMVAAVETLPGARMTRAWVKACLPEPRPPGLVGSSRRTPLAGGARGSAGVPPARALVSAIAARLASASVRVRMEGRSRRARRGGAD